jgi:transcriptional regulator with XRE-family HTH domain
MRRPSRKTGRPPRVTTTTSPIGLELLALVRKSGLTEDEICKRAGIGKNQMTRIRTGETQVPMQKVLARLLPVLVASAEARDAFSERAAIERRALAARRAFPVPPELRRDWETLKIHNYTNAEAARVLGLPYGEH